MAEAKHEEKLFYDRLSDLVHGVERDWTARFTFFLDERQQALAQRHLHYSGFHHFMLWSWNFVIVWSSGQGRAMCFPDRWIFCIPVSRSWQDF